MRYFYICVIFIFGVVLGRWSAPHSGGQGEKFSSRHVFEESNPQVARNMPPPKAKQDPQVAQAADLASQIEMQSPKSEMGHSRKALRNLFDQLMEDNKRDDLFEQNKLLAEMESLDPKNEQVFQAKAMILQDNDDWNGAHRVLEECVAAIPNSVFCFRRLANIRSSTTEDRLRYGTECLRVSNNDPLCLVDVALALNSKGEFVNAKTYFELALSLPQAGEGYNRDYILLSYAFALEGLNMHQKATEALVESCRLKNKAACEKLRT
jgi:tetratricopeptide (TPR) repeat protein